MAVRRNRKKLKRICLKFYRENKTVARLEAALKRDDNSTVSVEEAATLLGARVLVVMVMEGHVSVVQEGKEIKFGLSELDEKSPFGVVKLDLPTCMASVLGELESLMAAFARWRAEKSNGATRQH